MSAFIVSHKHINVLVSFAGAHNTSAYSTSRKARIPIAGNEQAIAELLLAENTRSVNHRYTSNDQAEEIHFRFENTLNSVAILRACACLEYQSCEADDYESTDAFAVLKAIRAAAIESLPGYSEADWEIR